MIRQLLHVLDPSGAAALRRLLVLLVLGAVLQGVAFVLLVPVLRSLFGSDPATAWPWLAGLAVVAAAYGACHWRSQLIGYDVATGLARALHGALGARVARLPLGWFTTGRTGRLAQLASTNVTEVMGAPAQLFRPVVTALVTPAVVVVAMAVLQWRLAVAVALVVPVGAWAFRLTGRLVAGTEHALDAAGVEASSRLVEFAQNQPVLRAFRRTGQGHHLLDDALLAQRDAAREMLVRVAPGFAGFVVVVGSLAIPAGVGAGVLLRRIGRKRALMTYGGLQAVAIMLLLPLAGGSGDVVLATSAVCAVNMAYAATSTVINTVNMDLARPRTAATDFTVLNSFALAVSLVGGALALVLAGQVGYPTVVAASVVVVALACTLTWRTFVDRSHRDQAALPDPTRTATEVRP